MPWRPPQNRDPEPEEIAMMRPFVERHIELVDPAVIVAMGNTPCQCLLGTKGILRLRGTTHLLFAGLFYWLGATTMAWVNLGSVTLFTSAPSSCCGWPAPERPSG